MIAETAAAAYDEARFKTGLEALHESVVAMNFYFQSEKPWTLRADPERLHTILYVANECLRILGIVYQPIMPDAASRMLTFLSVPDSQRTIEHAVFAGDGSRSGVPLTINTAAPPSTTTTTAVSVGGEAAAPAQAATAAKSHIVLFQKIGPKKINKSSTGHRSAAAAGLTTPTTPTPTSSGSGGDGKGSGGNASAGGSDSGSGGSSSEEKKAKKKLKKEQKKKSKSAAAATATATATTETPATATSNATANTSPPAPTDSTNNESAAKSQ